MKGISFTLVCLAAVVATGCTVHQTEAPGLSGPSEFALSVSMAASPDTLFSGGLQQSTIVVTARDASGAPKANQTFRLDTAVGNAYVAYGTLSAQTVVTGSDGKATVMYTMPSFTPFDAGTPSRRVAVVATPVGTDYAGAVPHLVELLVVPPPVPTAVAGAPSAALAASTTSAKVGQLVSFDASGSQAAPGRSIVLYYWNFGDNLLNEEHGSDASHVFVSPGTYTVVLGVQDDTGKIASTFKTIVVTS
ncbi:MAG: PKD domain-containing protein [Acidobacteria bacterium]|nr:PKD domain-containing protein [Acidobacteriota bacterium]